MPICRILAVGGHHRLSAGAGARAKAALERGRHADAIGVLTQALKSSGLKHEDELGLRCTLAEAWLMGDDVAQAAATLGRPPDSPRDDLSPALLSALWRLHGRIAFAKGDQSRAIALLGRALRHAEQAHDSEAIGLAHYELGHCYKQVGDTAIVREHIAKAAPALHAAGNRRYLALLHSLSGVVLAQGGRMEEAMAALRQAESLAASVQAQDVLGIICNNQANVALIQHRHDQALTLSEQSRGAAGAERPGTRPRHLARDARPDSRAASASSSAPKKFCIARSRPAVRRNSTRLPAPCTTRWRRSR